MTTKELQDLPEGTVVYKVHDGFIMLRHCRRKFGRTVFTYYSQYKKAETVGSWPNPKLCTTDWREAYRMANEQIDALKQSLEKRRVAAELFAEKFTAPSK